MRAITIRGVEPEVAEKLKSTESDKLTRSSGNEKGIDTKIYSLAMRGEGSVVDILRKIDLIGFSVVSIGELYSG